MVSVEAKRMVFILTVIFSAGIITCFIVGGLEVVAIAVLIISSAALTVIGLRYVADKLFPDEDNKDEITIDYITSEGLTSAFKKLGWRIDAKGFIRDAKGKYVCCAICGDKLKKDTLGAFAPGLRPLCSNVKCHLVDMYEREKLED